MESPPRHLSPTIQPALLARVAQGDQQAFEQLYDESSSLLFTLAMRILGDRDEAEELMQDVYLEVWRKVVRYDTGRGSPIAWLVTITRSRAIDRLRSRAAKGHGLTTSIEETQAAELPNRDPSPFETQANSELRTSVRKALAELPGGQREALELAYYKGLSHSEIAVSLNEPLGTIKTRIKLGMSKLRTALCPWWGEQS
jgi:RNA polymerase sigma-70 factor (ECF subfamily)